MNGDNKNTNGLNWDDWLERYQHDQDGTRKDISQLTKDVADLTATVRQLVENQRGLFSHQHRPVNWGAILTAIGMAAAFVALIVAPMKREDFRQHSFDIRMMEHLVEDAREMGKVNKDLEWLHEMEDRLNRRIHSE